MLFDNEKGSNGFPTIISFHLLSPHICLIQNIKKT